METPETGFISNVNTIAEGFDAVQATANSLTDIATVNEALPDIRKIVDIETSKLDVIVGLEPSITSVIDTIVPNIAEVLQSGSNAQASLEHLNAITGLSVTAVTLAAGSEASASYNSTSGVLTLGVPEGESFEVDARGSSTDRSNYDTQPKGFAFLDLENSLIYFKLSTADGDWSVGVSFGKGDTGNIGLGWLFGDGVPSNESGADGELYLDQSTSAVYTKEGGVWTFSHNLNGSVNDLQTTTGLTWSSYKIAELLTLKSDASHNHDIEYEPINLNIQAHIANKANPHEVALEDITPTTTTGDLLVHGTGGLLTRVPVGGDGFRLVADSSEVAGVRWEEKFTSTVLRNTVINQEPISTVSADTIGINQGTLISFAGGFNAENQVDIQEVVGADVTLSFGAGYEDKHYWLYKDLAGSYGVSEFRPLTGITRNDADMWGVESPSDSLLRTTAKHFDYESSTGVVSASGEFNNYKAFNLLDKKEDANSENATWTVETTTSSWVQYKFSEKRVLKSWRIRARDNISQLPRLFTIEGSNDGLNWNGIDTTYTSNDYVGNGSSLWGDLQSTSGNTTAYLYYRINITANSGDATYTSMAELEFNTILPSDYYLINEGVMYDSTNTPIERTYLAELMTDGNGDVSWYKNLPVAKQRFNDVEVYGGLDVRGTISNSFNYVPIGVPFFLNDHQPAVSPPTDSKAATFIKLTAGESGVGGYNEGKLINEVVSTVSSRLVATAEIAIGARAGEVIYLVNSMGAFYRPSPTSGNYVRDSFGSHKHSVPSWRSHTFDASGGSNFMGADEGGYGSTSMNTNNTGGTETAPVHVTATAYERIV